MSTQGRAVQIDLPEVEPAQAGRLAAELSEFILMEDSDLEIELVRAEPDAQDFGASLVLLLAAPATIAVARGIKKWIERRGMSSLQFKSGDTTLKLENLSDRTARQLSEDLILLVSEGQPKP